MNGEETKELKNVSNRLLILETTFRERWKAHDERSESIWITIQHDIKSISNRLIAVADSVTTKTNSFRNEMWCTIRNVLGIPAVLVAVICITVFLVRGV